MSKTINEWLEELNAPQKHIIHQYALGEGSLNVKVDSILEAIWYAFSWPKSPEGLRYWIEFCQTLEKPESPWISVNDRLPEHDSIVLIPDEERKFRVCKFKERVYGTSFLCEITKEYVYPYPMYYMETTFIPEPPKE